MVRREVRKNFGKLKKGKFFHQVPWIWTKIK
jgi:hypothetical protein